MRHRYIIYALIATACGAGLALFDDVDIGLPIINLVIWPVVVAVGFVVLFRKPATMRLKSRSARRLRQAREADRLLIVDRVRPRLKDR